MPTTRGLALLGGGVLLWLVGRVLGIAELNVVAVTAVAVVVAGCAAVRIGSTSLAVRRSVATGRLWPDTAVDVVLHLRNQQRLPTGLLLVSDDVPARLAADPRFVVPGLAGGAATSLRYSLVGHARGRYAIGPVAVRVRDPFGTAEHVRRCGDVDEVLVYPRVEPLAGSAVRGASRGSGSSATRRLLASGDEFYTMREYVTGDDLRQVHWPSTARRSTLMVRQQEQPWQAQATTLLDLRAVVHRGAGPDSTLEHAISAAASIVWHLAERGYEQRLVTDSGAGSTRAEPWPRLLERLAEASPSDTVSLAPVLQRLRGTGAAGLLAAVVAPPPARRTQGPGRRGPDEPLARHPEVQALLQAGRAFDERVALVVAPVAGSERAEALAALLDATGWRAATIAPRTPVADTWQALLARRRATGGSAFQPDPDRRPAAEQATS
ncbi:MAG TPA: DUF58 domain-containing protein [Egibacteraceae bacterium]